MKHRFLLFSIVLVIGLPIRSSLAQAQSTSVPGTPIPFTRWWTNSANPHSLLGASGAKQPQQVVIKDQQQWREVWAQLYRFLIPPPALLDVDFTRNQIVLVSMGERPSSGYSISIESIYEREGRLEVNVIKRSSKNCIVLGVITYPVDIVRLPLPKSETTVVFHEKDLFFDCNETRPR